MIKCKFESGKFKELRHVVVDSIVINEDASEILLIKRAEHMLQGGKWAMPGGFLDRDESTSVAILREMQEETGYSGEVVKLLWFLDSPKRFNEDNRQNVSFVYLIKAKKRINDPDNEVAEVKWYKINEIPDAKDFAFDHYENVQRFIKENI